MPAATATPNPISRRKLKSLDAGHNRRTAEAADLRYVSAGEPGISRIAAGKGFHYKSGGRTVTNKKVLARIQALVLPPAWTDVWICKDDDGHLQATGIDAAGRKQYRYHAHWQAMRGATKFYHLYEFGKALPLIRERLHADLAQSDLSRNKVLALVVAIMCETGIRIGNAAYEKLYGSFGLTTLKDQHVRMNKGRISFSFRGKKGVHQRITLRSRKLSHLVRQCRDIPGKELFQYFDGRGEHCAIDSGQVNGYIKEISGGNFSAKDFRTWTGSLQGLNAFLELGVTPEKITERRRNAVAALDSVAAMLGNTRTVCKKYYVHPTLLTMYEEGTLEKYLKQLKKTRDGEPVNHLFPNERVLMRVLGL